MKHKVTLIKVMGLAVLSLLFSACATTPTPKIEKWGPQYATPGAVFLLEEIKREKLQNKTGVVYTIYSSGLPEDKEYSIWNKKLDGTFNETVTGIKIDKSGKLTVLNGKIVGKIGLSDYVRGEPGEFGTISTDQAVRAFTRVIPIPIESRANNESCRLSVELISPRATAFGITGEGFEPNETITTRSQSNNEILDAKHQASKDGKFGVLLFPAVVGQKSGTEKYTAVGKSCEVTVQFEWGPSALKIQ
jgi:hypothetical protein